MYDRERGLPIYVEGLSSDVNDVDDVVGREIASQPSVWERVVADGDWRPSGLAQRGERVAVAGCGTSWFVAMAYACRRELLGYGETDAQLASEYLDRAYDRLLLVSRSGTTTEVLELAKRLRGGPPMTLLTAEPSSPIAGYVEDVVVLDFADEQAVVQTRFATTALVLLRRSLDDLPVDIIEQGRAALAFDLGFAEKFEHIVFLGRGWTIGIAREAALKVLEMSQIRAEAFPGLDYRHGPISAAGQGTAVFCFDDDKALAADITATGATVVRLPFDPVASLIVAQRLGHHLATRRGLDPGQPIHLTRSVILPDVATN